MEQRGETEGREREREGSLLSDVLWLRQCPPPAAAALDGCLPPTLLLDLFLGRPTAIVRARSPPSLPLSLSLSVSPLLEFLRCPLSRFFSIVLLVCRPPGRGPFLSPSESETCFVERMGFCLWALAVRPSVHRAPIREIESLGRRIVLGLPSSRPEGRKKKGCPIKLGVEA